MIRRETVIRLLVTSFATGFVLFVFSTGTIGLFTGVLIAVSINIMGMSSARFLSGSGGRSMLILTAAAVVAFLILFFGGLNLSI